MKTARKNSAFALIGTVVFFALATLLWMTTFRQTANYLRTEKASRLYAERHLGCTQATAWALNLLETGLPPENPYSCWAILDGQPAKTYVLTFVTDGENSATVSVRPATDADSSLPLAPDNFSTGD